MKIGGQIPWNVIPICETFKISCLVGKLHTRDVLGNHFAGPIIPFGSLVEYHPKKCEGPVKNPSMWKESLTWIVPRIRVVRGGTLEG